MADADYGYVGAGRGKISLYKKKECIEKNIPEEQAVEKLLELISRNGRMKNEEFPCGRSDSSFIILHSSFNN